MKSSSQIREERPLQIYFYRMRGVFWVSSILISAFTFFAPLLTESSERYSMTGEIAVSGYEMVTYTPLLATFVITAPVLTAMLHSAELPDKKKMIMYVAWMIFYELLFCASLILTAIDLLNVEHHLVRVSAGSYLVLAANFLGISLGALPTLWVLIAAEEEDEY